jgi:hypothetical protein
MVTNGADTMTGISSDSSEDLCRLYSSFQTWTP